jgi:ERCC4-related helicase
MEHPKIEKLKEIIQDLLKQHNVKELVVITKEEFDALNESSKMLSALEEAGVDNWEGYHYAYDYLEEDEIK